MEGDVMQPAQVRGETKGGPGSGRLVAPREAVPPIAADTTLLVAASSFIEPSSGLEDPRAELASDSVVSAFCSGPQLVLPLPKQGSGYRAIFLELWRQSVGVTEVHDLELDDDDFASVVEAMEPGFSDYIEGMPGQAASWVQFQFTDLSGQDGAAMRAHERAILRAGPVADSLLREGRLTRSAEAILRLERERTMREPAYYTHLLEAPEIRSFLHLCAAYTISFCARGFSYALSLGRLESSPVYRHHWIRTPALKAERLTLGAPAMDPNPPAWFPWGPILRSVFDPKLPLVERSRGKAMAVIAQLRDEAARFRRELGGDAEVVRGAEDPRRITDGEAYVLETLARAGVYPRYRGSTRARALVKWLRAVVGADLPWR